MRCQRNKNLFWFLRFCENVICYLHSLFKCSKNTNILEVTSELVALVYCLCFLYHSDYFSTNARLPVSLWFCPPSPQPLFSFSPLFHYQLFQDVTYKSKMSISSHSFLGSTATCIPPHCSAETELKSQVLFSPTPSSQCILDVNLVFKR